MSNLDKYVWLVSTVRRYGPISRNELSRLWEAFHDGKLSERTFHNHKDAVAILFGIKIKYERGLGYYIGNEDDLENNSLKTWMLDCLSTNNLLNESADMRDRILFESVPSSQNWLEKIIQAMKINKVIHLTYKRYYSDLPHSYDIEAYCLKLYRRRWYLLAKKLNHSDFRIFALDRICNILITDKNAAVDPNFDAKSYFCNYFGVILDTDKKVEFVEIKVSADNAKYIEFLPLHHSQELIERNDKYSVFRYYIVPSFDFRQEILSRGSSAEVLSPKWFREEVAEEINKMKKNY